MSNRRGPIIGLIATLAALVSVGSYVVAQQSGSGLPGGATNSTQYKLNGTSFGGAGPGTAGQVLTSNGAGSPPSFQAGSSVTPAALTRTDDTNVTLTLGGTPTTALLQATSITAGWTGQLGVARGGTNLSASADDNVMVGNGTTWQTKALTSCSGASDAVTYNTSTNAFGCNTISASASLTATQVGFGNGSNVLSGESDFLWDSTNNRLTIGSTATPGLMRGADTAGAGTNGGNLTVRAGENSSNGSGGSLTVTGGDGTGTSRAGGSVTVQGGSSVTSGNGGDVTLTGGVATSGNSGSVIVKNGATTRLTIEPDGSWNVGGSNGTSGQVLASTGSTTAPAWTSPGSIVSTTGQFTANWTQACSTTPTQVWNYTLTGGQVVISPQNGSSGDVATCTGDSTFFITSTDMPASIRPNTQTVLPGMFLATNNGSTVNTCLRLQADGSMELINSGTNAVCGTSSGSWTASGNRSWSPGTGSLQNQFVYQLDNN